MKQAVRELEEADLFDIPLDELDPAQPALFAADRHWRYFDRLRAEDPVHFTRSSEYGPYWSVTRYHDIVEIDSNHEVFSSDAYLGGVTIGGLQGTQSLPMFIAMDPPEHGRLRKTVTPIVSSQSLREFGPLIRQRVGVILDELPIGEPFDWVERVSTKLTSQMLATLFDYPLERCADLVRWSDVATAVPGHGVIDSAEQYEAEMSACFAAFEDLWQERVRRPPKGDLVSMLAHGAATAAMDPRTFYGNMVLLMVGGNDTTRNTITGSVLALDGLPNAYLRLRYNPQLLPNMVSECVRWQTPLAHMRRTALQNIEFRGKRIRKGDQVVMWYVSGNRDERAIEEPYEFRIDRAKPRQHLAFGFGVHRCVGNRLAELQLQILWEEILRRFPRVEPIGAPARVHSCFIRGYRSLMVRIPGRL